MRAGGSDLTAPFPVKIESVTTAVGVLSTAWSYIMHTFFALSSIRRVSRSANQTLSRAIRWHASGCVPGTAFAEVRERISPSASIHG
jgi:hypothetical protein